MLLVELPHLAIGSPTEIGLASIAQVRVGDRVETATGIKACREFARERFVMDETVGLKECCRPMDVDVLTETVIRRPSAVVSAYAADPDRAPEWYENIKLVEWKTARPLAIGSRVAFVAQFLGRTLRYTYEVVEWVPSERFVMGTADGPFPMETTYTWSDAAGGTRMTLRHRGKPTGFSIWLAPLMRLAMRRANRKDLAARKALLERDSS